MLHQQNGTDSQVNETSILRDEEMTQMLITLTAQTNEQKIKWTCIGYRPIEFSMLYPREPEGDAEIDQIFEGYADFRGQAVNIVIYDTIYLPSQKGDISVEISLLGAEYSKMLALESGYDDCSASEILKQYGQSSVVLFANAVVPVLMKEINMTVNGLMQGKIFGNNPDIPESLIGLSVVKTAQRLRREGRAMEFHRMILDTNYRKQLRTK